MLKGKRGLILGVANKRSIAWAIAKACDRHGATLALSYQNDRVLKNVTALGEELQSEVLLAQMDVTNEDEMDALFERVKGEFGHLDFLVHALAFAHREDLEGEYMRVSRQGWDTALGISAYSFTALAKRAAPLMEGRAGSLLTLSYLGGERVVPNYNVMGVSKAALDASVRYLAADLGPAGHRVNAISAGPIRTLAASGISGFSDILDHIRTRAPLRRNVTTEEIADTAVFYLSDMSRAITGELCHVDCGYSIMGV